MKYFILSPEVAAMGLGVNTIMDRTVHPPIVSYLHYDFDVWLGDDLLEGFPCFIATDRLAEAIQNAGLSGTEFRPVAVSTSEQFKDMYGERELPPFVWLYPSGRSGVDDFGVDATGRLVVSENALALLRTMKIDHCDVSELV